MRATLISMVIVSLLAAGMCICSVAVIGSAAEELGEMREEVMEMIAADDAQGAQERIGRMAEKWSEQEEMLAALAPHDTLHEITELLIEGDANLRAGDRDDFIRSMALLGEAIRHLLEEERLSIANIL